MGAILRYDMDRNQPDIPDTFQKLYYLLLYTNQRHV